jgi:hypothetical protein
MEGTVWLHSGVVIFVLMPAKAINKFILDVYVQRGHAVVEWLRHYATRRKVAVSMTDEVMNFFNLSNPSGHTRPSGLLSF